MDDVLEEFKVVFVVWEMASGVGIDRDPGDRTPVIAARC